MAQKVGILLLFLLPTHWVAAQKSSPQGPPIGKWNEQQFFDPGSVGIGDAGSYPTPHSGPYARNGFANAVGDRAFSQYGVHDVRAGVLVDPNAPEASSFRQSFDPQDPDLYYFHAGSELRSYNLSTGQQALVRDFGVQLEHLGGSVDWIDRTGRYMVLNLAGDIRIYDKFADRLFTGTLPASLFVNGWIGISPDARWLVAAEIEHQAFPIDLSTQTLNTNGHVF